MELDVFEQKIETGREPKKVYLNIFASVGRRSPRWKGYRCEKIFYIFWIFVNVWAKNKVKTQSKKINVGLERSSTLWPEIFFLIDNANKVWFHNSISENHVLIWCCHHSEMWITWKYFTQIVYILKVNISLFFFKYIICVLRFCSKRTEIIGIMNEMVFELIKFWQT
jgi:hypothetical protein